MEYKGKLYGRVAGQYFPLEHTTDDFERLEKRCAELEALTKQTGTNTLVSGSLPPDIERILIVVARRWGGDHPGSTVGIIGDEAIQLLEKHNVNWRQ